MSNAAQVSRGHKVLCPSSFVKIAVTHRHPHFCCGSPNWIPPTFCLLTCVHTKLNYIFFCFNFFLIKINSLIWNSNWVRKAKCRPAFIASKVDTFQSTKIFLQFANMACLLFVCNNPSERGSPSSDPLKVTSGGNTEMHRTLVTSNSLACFFIWSCAVNYCWYKRSI